ncbi:hypothetical protein HK104_000803 [Borealophlyctis nickersoniae]|nr:hypothetical protein HK104_000803 [Borealophlyctis nickersoniae]
MAVNYQSHSTRRENHHGGDMVEGYFRAKGIPFYAGAILTKFQANDPRAVRFQPSLQQRKINLILSVKRKEHYSVYSKGTAGVAVLVTSHISDVMTHQLDDIWIVSPSLSFDKTFLAKSYYYGPSANGAIELTPLSERDAREAQDLMKSSGCSPTHVFAIRGVNANNEMLMISNLKENAQKMYLMPWILDYANASGPAQAQGGKAFRPASRAALIKQSTLGKYHEMVNDVAIEFKLNVDQRHLETETEPLGLVHGVSMDPDSCMLHIHALTFTICRFLERARVAVDRILLVFEAPSKEIEGHKWFSTSKPNHQGLLKLGFDDFVRVGSLKKMAKQVLPYAAQAKNVNDDLKELESMLKDEGLTASEKKGHDIKIQEE